MKLTKKVEDRLKNNVAKFKKVLAVAKNRDLNESDTVAIINDMLSEVFGDEKYTEITSELMIRGTYCDLAIRLNDKFESGFLIECKRVGVELKEEHMRQAVNYGVNKGIQWVILTNGIDWRLYRLRFEQPVSWDLVARFDWEALDLKSEHDLEKLFCLCKEGIEKNAREELYEKVQCVNRFVIGQLILQEPVVSILRRELRKMSEGIIIEPEEVEKILRVGVLRGDLMAEDETEVQNAIRRVNKFYRQTTKKCEKKPTERKESPPATLPEPKPSLTEQLLSEAEANAHAISPDVTQTGELM